MTGAGEPPHRTRGDDLAGDDAARAYQAVGRLAGSPAEALPWLREHLQPVPPVAVDGKRLDRLLSELDSDDFAVRERATKEIGEYGEFARPAFERVLSGQPSAEVRSRIEMLAEKCAPARSPERLRALRAVEVLENLGTPEAQRLLERLATGAPEAGLTQEAKASLERLARRPAPSP